MKNIDVIKKFISGDKTGKTQNLRIEDNNLINYSTIIAKRIDGKIYLNSTKYSQTISTIQNKIRNNTPSKLLIEVNAAEILRLENRPELLTKIA